MTRRYAGSKVVVGLCALALGLSSVGFAGRHAMSACAVVEEPAPEGGGLAKHYVFEWEACEGSERLAAIQRGIVLWSAVGAVSLLTALLAFRASPRLEGEQGPPRS